MPISVARLSAALILSLALVSMSQAQAPDTLEGTLEEITINASRSTETEETAPFAVSVIEVPTDVAQMRSSTTLKDALATLPGVWINDRENFSLGERLAIRGFGSQADFGVRGVQVLLDGIPLTMPDGQSSLGIVDPAFIRRAEVIRGPASSFWGNGSGGVLSLTTREYPEQWETRVRSLAGSYGLRKFGADVGGAIGSHRLRGFVSHHQQDGFRDHSRGERTRAALFSDWDTGTRSHHRVVGAFMNAPENQNPSSMTKAQSKTNPQYARDAFVANKAGESNLHAQGGAAFNYQTGVGLLTVNSWAVRRHVDNPLPWAYIRVRRNAGGGRVQLHQQQGALQWGIGADAGLQSDNRENWNTVVEDSDRRIASKGDEVLLDQHETVTNGALFGRISRRFGGVTIGGGLRYDRLRFAMDDHLITGGPASTDGDQSGSRLFSAWSPMAGITYDIGPTKAYFNASTSFEAPTTTELVNRPDMTGGFNQQLEPKRSRGLETGIRGGIPGQVLEYDIAFYGYRVNGLLVSAEGPGGRAYYQNEGRTRHIGVETRLAWRMIPTLRAIVTANINQFTFQSGDFEGHEVPGLPPRRATGVLRWMPGDWYASLEAQSVSSYYVNNANDATNDAYTVLDARIGHTNLSLGGGVSLQPFFAVNNVTNTRYNGSVIPNAFGGRFYEPAPDRTWQAGISVEFGP